MLKIPQASFLLNRAHHELREASDFYSGTNNLDLKSFLKIETDQLQSLFLEGEGAGGKATASSVISDLYEIFCNSKNLSLGYSSNNLKNYKKFNYLELESSFYLRLMTKDFAGVLSKITSSFKDFNISIEKIFQLPDNNNKSMPIPIIITTHKVKKEILLKTITEIQKQDFILEKIVLIPIHNNN